MMPHPVRQRSEPFVGDFAIPMGLRAQGHDQTDGCARHILAYQAQRRFQWALTKMLIPKVKRPPDGSLFALSLSQLNDTAKGLYGSNYKQN